MVQNELTRVVFLFGFLREVLVVHRVEDEFLRLVLELSQVDDLLFARGPGIAFLLLIFFLVATTMNVDTGLVRMLPPVRCYLKAP